MDVRSFGFVVFSSSVSLGDDLEVAISVLHHTVLCECPTRDHRRVDIADSSACPGVVVELVDDGVCSLIIPCKEACCVCRTGTAIIHPDLVGQIEVVTCHVELIVATDDTMLYRWCRWGIKVDA